MIPFAYCELASHSHCYILLSEKYDEAWRHLERAHADLLASRDPEAASLAVIEERSMQIQQIFTKNFFPTGVGSKSKTPVFIVGMMRSVVCTMLLFLGLGKRINSF